MLSKLVLIRFAYLLKFYLKKNQIFKKKNPFEVNEDFGTNFYLKRRRMRMMQSQGMNSKVAVKVSKRQVLKAEGKKIKDALNMLIQVLEESRRI